MDFQQVVTDTVRFFKLSRFPGLQARRDERVYGFQINAGAVP
jgi:hypothetical protein